MTFALLEYDSPVDSVWAFEDRGLAFAPYAAKRLRGATIDALGRNARMMRAEMAD